jgi:hypothetical protein
MPFDRLDNWGILALVLSILALVAVAMWLMLWSGRRHPPEEIETDATDYGQVVRSGHAPLTLFLYLFISGVIVWMIIYFWLHIGEFAALGTHSVY